MYINLLNKYVVERYPIKAPCDKILHYRFNGTYDSRSCYNFASGVPYGKPYLTGNMLCLNGIDQFVSVSSWLVLLDIRELTITSTELLEI